MGGGEHGHGLRSDCTAAVMPPLQNSAPWRVAEMAILDGHTMQVCFVDGVKGMVRFGPHFYRGVFADLLDYARFSEARLEMGAVTWPGERDIAPDRMHDDIMAHGECVLGAEAP